MRHLILGFGSIGRRHYANLRALRPDDEIVTVDPYQSDAMVHGVVEIDNLVSGLIPGSVVYICAPTNDHLRLLCRCAFQDARAIFVEKPLVRASDTLQLPPAIQDLFANCVPCAVGYCYRFHPLFRQIKSMADRLLYLHLFGSEDVSGKYGATALETMLSHSIDLALWINGDAKVSEVHDRKVSATVGIRHAGDAYSCLHADMLSSLRVATCTVFLFTPGTVIHEDIDGNLRWSGDVDWRHWFVEPSDQMYVDEMQAWLDYLDTGDAGELCTFPQAIRVQRIMSNG